MTDEATGEIRYWHAEHCDMYMDLKTTGKHREGATLTDLPCAECEQLTPVTEVDRLAHERYTALEDDCKNCGNAIIFLSDLLEWRHHDKDEVPVTMPDYGVRSCEEAVGAVLGIEVAIPEYAGKVAEPSDSHVTLDLKTGDEASASEQAKEIVKKKAAIKKRAVEDLMPSFFRSVE